MLMEKDEIPNDKKTTKGGYCQMDGSTGKLFTNENQPSSEAKKAGWKKKKALKGLLAAKPMTLLGSGNVDYAQLAADFFEIPKEHVTVKMIMHFRQMERAILKADTQAYMAVMDRAFGKPTQALTGANNTPLNPTEHKIVHVHSNVPLAGSEDEVKME